MYLAHVQSFQHMRYDAPCLTFIVLTHGFPIIGIPSITIQQSGQALRKVIMECFASEIPFTAWFNGLQLGIHSKFGNLPAVLQRCRRALEP